MPRYVALHAHGGPDVLSIESRRALDPARDEISIAIKAFGLNRSEAQFREGRHLEQDARLPAQLGYEASGEVVALGDGVEAFRVGEAVSILTSSVTRWGTYAEQQVFPARFASKFPAMLSWIEAASIWMPNVTAYGGLIDVAHLQAGDYVLVVAGGSSVGIASIQIAKDVGATAIATTRSRDKSLALIDAGADHVIITTEEDLAARVDEITMGQGVRVVFDPVGGPGIAQLFPCMSQFGVLVSYGVLTPEAAELPLLPIIGKGLTIRGFTFKELMADAQRLSRAQEYILPRLESGVLKPCIDRVFEFEDIVKAHAYLEGNQQFGKIVVRI